MIPPWLAKVIPFALAALAIFGAIATIHHKGEQAGAAKVTREVDQQHTARVAEARSDEHAASAITAAQASLTQAHTDAAIAALQLQEARLSDALHAIPPVEPGTPLPVAPAGVLAAPVNALIDRANRAAGPADPAG